MGKQHNKQERYPLSINFKTLDQYNFKVCKLDEVCFFEWLIVKRESFGNNTFFYQQKRIFNELGIKRSRLTKIKDLFIKYGLIIELKNKTNLTHFTVNDEFIKTYIHKHIKKEYQSNLKVQLLKLNFKKGTKLKASDQKYVDALILELNNTFKNRREIYARELGTIRYSDTELPKNFKTFKQLDLLRNSYNDETIKNSFISYCDTLLKMDFETHHILNSFSSYDETENKFPLFELHLEKFNLNYSQKVDKHNY